LVWGCNSRPKEKLSKDEMAAIIVDLKLLESKVDNFLLRSSDSSKIAFRYLQHQVFKKHKTDSTTYFENYDYYLSHKKQMLEILENASETLAKTQEEQLPKEFVK